LRGAFEGQDWLYSLRWFRPPGEPEAGLRAALAKGTLVETSVLKPTMILRIPEIGLNHVIDGEIALV
jgi:uncharacterized protein DUF6494